MQGPEPSDVTIAHTETPYGHVGTPNVPDAIAGGDLDDARWLAVAQRSAAADGLFVYAVRSTGIYCRPACPARRPLRRNVAFFPTAAEAAAAGFRACRRCRPEQGRDADPAAAAVIAACRQLEAHEAPVSLADLARSLGWSPRHFRRMFRAVTGVTPSAYARAQQADRARAALRSGAPVTDAVFDAGYGSTRGFYEHGAPRLGTSPSSYRQGSPGVHLRYSVIEADLGNVLVAATASGVCAVRIGAGEEDLLAELVAEFPRAHITCDDDGLAPVTAVVRALASGRSSSAAGSFGGRHRPRPARLRLPGGGVGGAAHHRVGLGAQLRRGGRPDRTTGRGPGRRWGLRGESRGAAGALPPGAPQRRSARRLPMGHRDQSRLAGRRGREHHRPSTGG